LRYIDPSGHAVVFKNGMIYSDLLSPAPQQKKTGASVNSSRQNNPAKSSGQNNNTNNIPGYTSVLGNNAQSTTLVKGASTFATIPGTMGGCLSANVGIAAFGTCSACLNMQAQKREIGGTFSLGGGGSTGFATGVGISGFWSSAKDMNELKGQDVFTGGSAWALGADYSWDRDNPKIKTYTGSISVGPDYSPEFGPAALYELHGGSTKTWGRTLFKY